jgi:hypothetical protein
MPELKSFIDNLNAIYNQPNPPLALNHYTSLKALDGITRTHTLRATYNRALNDPSEQVYAHKVLCESLQRMAPGKFGFQPDIQSTIPEGRHFVTSFCESGHLRDMWLGYADHGRGCCLEFDYSGLRNVGLAQPTNNMRMPLLAKVGYGGVPGRIEAHLRALCEGFRAEGSNIASSISHVWLFIASMIKDRAFEKEQEWRIIVVDPPDERVIYLPGETILKRYVELSWLHWGSSRGCLPLKRVTYNSAFDNDGKISQKIRSILDANAYSEVLVEPCWKPVITSDSGEKSLQSIVGMISKLANQS